MASSGWRLKGAGGWPYSPFKNLPGGVREAHGGQDGQGAHMTHGVKKQAVNALHMCVQESMWRF